MKRTLLTGLAIALLVLSGGCQLIGDDPTSPKMPAGDVPQETVIDLDSPTGGFAYTDEAPAFGEADDYDRILSEETAYDDPYRNEAEIQNMERNRRVLRYRLRAVWGRLLCRNDSTAVDCCGVDWTGRMHMEGGAIVIERVIAFDPQDSISRVDRSTIEWISHTCPHVDGVQVRIIVPPAGRADSLSMRPEVAPVLTIETGPYTSTFTLEELAAMEVVQPVDRCCNGISINSHIIPEYCPHGHLSGRWHSTDPDTIVAADSTVAPDSAKIRGIVHGVYRGIWMGANGTPSGYMRGVYGVNSAGEPVFFGKYIDMSGRIKGILRGRYGPLPEVTAASVNTCGYFKGEWIGRSQEVQGRLEGRWMGAAPGQGLFHGIWGMNCSKIL